MLNIINKLFKHKIKSCYIQESCTFTRIKSLNENRNIGNTITVKGWVKSIRNMKKFIFLDVNDGSCNNQLQIVINKSETPENLTWGSAVEVQGVLSETSKGQLELQTNVLKIIGECPITNEYPFSPRQTHAPEYIRKYLHLRSRTSNMNSLLRVRHSASLYIHNYFNNENFININTPILTSNDCEGAGEVFTVKPNNQSLLKTMAKENIPIDESYFDSKVFLSVSGQLHLEAMAHGLGQVYTFGPTFRAENSKSSLHLAEFYMIEAEKAFDINLNNIMIVIENLIKSVTKDILNNCEHDLTNFKDRLDHGKWLDKPFHIMTYEDAIKILQNQNLTSKVDKNLGLSKEQELFLVKYNNNIPTFVIEWPECLKPFYMRRSDNTKNVAAFDLLAPGVGELAGGSLRENRYDVLKNKLPKDANNLKWYLDLRKYGSVPTSGFGMGFERYLQFLLGISNIKDTIPFPRWPHNCSL